MGLESGDIHIDKEPDGVIIYTNGVNRDSSFANASQQQQPEFTDLDPQPGDTLDDNAETKHCEIKECDSENSVEVTKLCQSETCEQNSQSPNSEVNSSEDVPHEGKLTNNNKKTGAYGRKTTRSAPGNCKIKCTVPQPFALTTEKRASHAAGDKLSNVHILQHEMSSEQNPVNFSLRSLGFSASF